MDIRRIAEMAGGQHNRISRAQLFELGLSEWGIAHRIATGTLVIVEHGVLAVAPVLARDDLGRWMGATLTHPGSFLSHVAAAVAYEVLSYEAPLVSVTRPGSGGSRRHGNVLVHRSDSLSGDVTELHGIPITTISRTLLDITADVDDKALARAVREAVRKRT